MNVNYFLENVIEQIKEAQLKLGFAKEVIRLYFPADSLCKLLQVKVCSGRELVAVLEKEDAYKNTALGTIGFSLCKGERIEVSIPVEGAVYVHEKVENPPFLEAIIDLFQNNHHLTIEEICACMERFNQNYVCEKMKEGSDFDYVLYYPDHKPDVWYYCVRMEMGHTIYHRFTEYDYCALLG